MDAWRQEIKERSPAAFTAQLAEARAFLGDRLALYQSRSLTTDFRPLDDPELLAALADLRAQGVIVGSRRAVPARRMPCAARSKRRCTDGRCSAAPR